MKELCGMFVVHYTIYLKSNGHKTGFDVFLFQYKCQSMKCRLRVQTWRSLMIVRTFNSQYLKQ